MVVSMVRVCGYCGGMWVSYRGVVVGGDMYCNRCRAAQEHPTHHFSYSKSSETAPKTPLFKIFRKDLS